MTTSRRQVLANGLALGVVAAVGVSPAGAVPPPAPVAPLLVMNPAEAGIAASGINGLKLHDVIMNYGPKAPIEGFETEPLEDAYCEPVTMELIRIDDPAKKYDSLYVALKALVPQEPRVITNICERLIAGNEIALSTRMAVGNLLIGNSETLNKRFFTDEPEAEQKPKGSFHVFWTDESFPDDVVLITLTNSRAELCRSFLYERVEDGVLVLASPRLHERAIFLDVSNYQTISEKMMIS